MTFLSPGMLRSRAIAMLVIPLLACAHAHPRADTAPKWEAADVPNASYALGHLRSIDIRLAARAGQPLVGTKGARLFALALHDPYLFADRRERLTELRTMLPPPLSVSAHTQEPALTNQLIDEEIARIEDESDDVARSSVDLLGPLLASKDSDDWMSFRIDDIRTALTKNGVSVFERAELLAIAMAPADIGEGTRTRESLRRLRDMLQNAHATSLPLLDRCVFRQRIAFQTRAHLATDAVTATLEHARTELRAQIDAALSVIGPYRSMAIRSHAANLLSEPAGCLPRRPARTAADLGPPPERARACGLASALAEASNDELEVTAILAMYEALGTACRAMMLHDQRSDLAALETVCPRILELGVDEDARQMRIAANHPVAAVVTGLAIELLLRGGMAHAPSRARRWMRFGDAPLHVLDGLLSEET